MLPPDLPLTSPNFSVLAPGSPCLPRCLLSHCRQCSRASPHIRVPPGIHTVGHRGGATAIVRRHGELWTGDIDTDSTNSTL